MSRKYKFRDQDKLYFVSFATVLWVDVFTHEEYRWAMLESIQYCQEHKGLEVYAWCIMPNHLHLIIGTQGEPMDKIMGSLKAFTSKKMKKLMENSTTESRKEWILWLMKRISLRNKNNKSFQFWQQNSHPIELNGNEMMEQKLDYLHQNPVTAGFVDEASHWRWSSARDYYTDQSGLLNNIILIE